MELWHRWVGLLCGAALVLGSCTQTQRRDDPTLPLSASLGARPLPDVHLPTSLPGPLDGEVVPRSLALRRPLAVIVDNYAPDARPQSGLSQASVVIETLTEGGITRFMAIYLEKDASSVGPVRSSRVYFDRWAGAFHAILVHVGGNDDAEALLWHLPSVFQVDAGPWRPAYPFWLSGDRFPPYNVYTSTSIIRADAERLHQDWDYAQAFFPHKRPAPLSRRGHAGSLSISFVDPLLAYIPANPDYTVRYDFDRTTDTYLRTMGGAPHVDGATHQPLRAANVVVMLTGPAVADQHAGPTAESILIPTIGSGVAWYFLDGTVTAGRWEQRDQLAPLRFLDRHGRPIAFNPGQTWIEVLPKYSTAGWNFH